MNSEWRRIRLTTLDLPSFDPARDGFAFRNPVGKVPNRTGGGAFLRRFDPFLYGKGLCFGMAVASLLYFADRMKYACRPPLVRLSLTPVLLDTIQEYHARQYWPRVILPTVWDWVTSGGGQPQRVIEGLQLAGTSPDPHILCFGPAFNRRFFSRLAQAHAVVPYRVEEGRVYVYDPNYPGDRKRFVEFRWIGRIVEFAYDGFRPREGWGITLILSIPKRWIRQARRGALPGSR